MQYHNCFDLFSIGDKFFNKRTITSDLVAEFGRLSGDFNLLHIDSNYAKSQGFKGRVAYGNILGMMVSSLVGMHLGCHEVILLSQSLNFKNPFFIDDTIELCATVTNKSEAVKAVELSLTFINEFQIKIATGKCQIQCF